jgi:protein-tyrosine kinase
MSDALQPLALWPEPDKEGLDPMPPAPAFLQEVCALPPNALAQIRHHQQATGVTFDEAALALGLASPTDVLEAQALQQRHAALVEARQHPHPDWVMRSQPLGPQAEAFRRVRSHYLLHVRQRGGRRPLAVVSPDLQDGRSFFCANLAAALAQLEGRVLLIDANLRRPRLHEVLAVNDRTGLSDILAGRPHRHAVQAVPGMARLFLMPVGPTPPNPAELIESATFARLLQEAHERFDHVLVDTPACAMGMDAIITAARCGSALIVSRCDANKTNDLLDLKAALQAAQVDTVGVVLNEH